MKRIFVFLALLCLLPLVLGQTLSPESLGWHNDPGNDSCITAYADKAVYYTDRQNPIIEPVIKIVNDCGREVTGNVGLFFQTKDLEVNVYLVEQATDTVPILLNKNYVCSYTSFFDSKTGIGKCYSEDVNGNTTIFERKVNRLEGKTFYWTEVYESPQFFGNFAEQDVPVLSPQKEGFEKKVSYPTMRFKPGESHLRMGLVLPKGTMHRHGYFIITIEDLAEKSFKTILDPEWWETGEYAADGDTIAMWHCNESSGTNVPDSTGNYDGTASNSAIWDTGTKKWGAGACGLDETYYFSNNTLLDGGMEFAEWTLEAWMYPIVTLENPMTHSRLWNKTTQSGTDFLNTWVDNTGKLYANVKGNGTNTDLISTKSSWAADTWFHVMFIYDGTNWAMYIDGINETLETAGPQIRAGTQTDFYFGTSEGTPGIQVPNAIFDEIVISDVNRFATAPSYPSANTAPDINLLTVDGLSLFEALPYFSYNVDGNLTVAFNVSDIDNDRLTLDINLSTGQAIDFPGVILYEDLNLTSDICTDQDWDDGASLCSIDINASLHADANWWIHALLDDGTDTDTNVSGETFNIDNTVPTSVAFNPGVNATTLYNSVFFDHQVSDNNAGVVGCWFARYINGNRDINGFIDVNSGGYCHHTYDWLVAEGIEVYLRFYAVSDYADNNLYQIVDTGVIKRLFVQEADPEEITDEDLVSGFKYLIFSGFKALAGAFLLLIFLALAGVTIVLVLKFVL